MSAPRRSIRAAVAVAVACLLALGFGTVPARATTGTAKIVGTVIGGDGNGVGGASVTATDATGGVVAKAASDPTGVYLLDGLAPGTYVVEIHLDGYLDQWTSRDVNRPQLLQSGAEPITLADGERSTSRYTLLVAVGTALYGELRTGGALARDVPFCVTVKQGPSEVAEDCFRSSPGKAWNPGTYAIVGDPLVAGSYTLAFSGDGYGDVGDLSPQWFPGGKIDQSEAPAVTVPAGVATRADFDLTVGGSVRGTLTANDTGQPIAGVRDLCVYAQATDGRRYAANQSGTELTRRTCSRDFVNGTYNLRGLPTGTYKIFIDDFQGTYFATYYAGSPGTFDEAHAKAVPVSAGSATDGISATLVLGGTITGTITSLSTGQALDSDKVYVEAYDVNGELVASDFFVQANGTYHVGRLPTGNYRLKLLGSGSSHVTQWFDGAADLVHTPPIYVVQGTSVTHNQVLDDVAPIAVMTGPAAPGTVAPSAAFTFGGTDKGSGILNYDVRYRRAAWNGTFPATWISPPSWQGLTSRKVTAALPIGFNTCVSVRAKDKAGNISVWSLPVCHARALDDRSLTASAGWTHVTGTAFYGRTATRAFKTGAALTRTGAKIDRIGVVATRCPGCGKVALYIGTKLVGTVNLALSTTRNQDVLMLPAFPYRTGTVTLRVITSGKRVDIDGLVVSAT